jgi:ABC-type sugar transport system ATPase subunit
MYVCAHVYMYVCIYVCMCVGDADVVLHASGTFAFPGKLAEESSKLESNPDAVAITAQLLTDLPKALLGVSVSVRAGECVVVVGRVATGKSALLRMLCGTLSGKCRTAGTL